MMRFDFYYICKYYLTFNYDDLRHFPQYLLFDPQLTGRVTFCDIKRVFKPLMISDSLLLSLMLQLGATKESSEDAWLSYD